MLPIKPCVIIGGLPVSIMEALSYENQVLGIMKFLKDNIIPTLDTNTENITLLKEYVDEYLVGFEELQEQVAEIQDLVNRLNSQTTQNTQDIVLLREKINNDIESLKNYLEGEINDSYNILKEYVDYNINDLNNKITNIQIGAITVYNPTNGLLQPLQEVLNDLYEIGNKDGLTASEFDALELTATVFDAYEITAHEFDSEGKVILV